MISLSSATALAGKCLIYEGNTEHWMVPKDLQDQLKKTSTLRDCLNLSGDRGVNQILTLSYSDVRGGSLITFFIMDGNVVGTTEVK